MKTKYNINQITKALNKLFKAGFNTNKKILALRLEDLSEIPNLQANELEFAFTTEIVGLTAFVVSFFI